MSTPKVIVTVAPTGGFLTRQHHPFVPTQPDDIAADVYRCFNAGASMAALHARRADDQATCDPEIYRRINKLVRERCDVVINNSTGGGINGDMIRQEDDRVVIDWAERLRGLDGDAETCTLDAITAYVTSGSAEVLMDTPPSRTRKLAELMQSKGIKPEWEAFSPAHLTGEMSTLIDAGFDTAPYLVNMVLGMHTVFQNAMPYSPRILQHMVDLLPTNAIFTVSASGPEQTHALTNALLLGGHVRVGLEDYPYYSSGEPAENARLVERIVRIIRDLGMEPASPAEARELLGLPALTRTGSE